MRFEQAKHRKYAKLTPNKGGSGDELPEEGIVGWKVARELRNEINNHLSSFRSVPINRIRVTYIVTGKTGVWDGVLGKLKDVDKKGKGTEDVAIIDLKRETGTITFLEKGGPAFVSSVLKNELSEKRHLATCGASDFGITRSAGGVLGFAETRRPSVLVDEPGHWLGRIQREQCHEAGLCIVIPVGEFLKDPAKAIQEQANKLGTISDLDQTAKAAAKMPVGAEWDLAMYLFETYIE
jgi:hypothetical protein